MTDDTIDLEQLIDEIDDEVARRRAVGELDPEFERDLDGLFVTGAPRGGADLGRMLDQAQRAAEIDASPPASSRRPGGEVVKRALGRTMSWYVGNVSRQVGALGVELVEVARVLGERVTRLERDLERDGAVGEVTAVGPHLDLAPHAVAITDAVRAAAGRVLHGDAGDGVVVEALLAAGVDAYGVEPRTAFAERAALRFLEVREDSVDDHLRALPLASLGGLVLSGGVDTLANRPREELVRSARRALAPDGVLVVITADPSTWGEGASSVAADLSPGRPWHVETWAYLLADRGFDLRSVMHAAADGAHLLVAVRRPA